MNKLSILVKGELSRLNKYGVFNISIFVAIIWGAVLFLVDSGFMAGMLPFVLFLDATMMSVMYIGAEMHFEKTESTISTMLVTPVSNKEMVNSKIIANTIHNIVSSILIITVFFIAGKQGWTYDIGFNVLLVLLGSIISTSVFTILGLVLSYYQKDFTDMLVNIFVIVIFLMIPSILLMFGVIEGEFWENIMLLNPLQAAQEIIAGGFPNDTGEIVLTYKYYFSLAYLLVGGAAIYFLLAIPKFQDYAVRQSGV